MLEEFSRVHEERKEARQSCEGHCEQKKLCRSGPHGDGSKPGAPTPCSERPAKQVNQVLTHSHICKQRPSSGSASIGISKHGSHGESVGLLSVVAYSIFTRQACQTIHNMAGLIL